MANKLAAALALTGIVFTTACGGDGGGSGAVTVPPTAGTPPPSPPPPTSGTCSLTNRQNFAFNVINEWYLFPETLPASLNPSPFADVQSYINALTETARNQGRDRFFTFVTSIAEENAFFQSGSSAGFGIRIALDNNRLFIREAFENAPAFAAGIDRGTEITAIGNSEATLRSVSDIIASEGVDGINAALGPSTAGTSRAFTIVNGGASQNVTVTKAEYDIEPLSPNYGATVINDGGRQVGYINMRTFISTADNQLRSAFANLRAQGINDIVVDFRYNGGGLVSTANLFGDLLGRDRSNNDVYSFTRFRASKSANDETRNFDSQPQSIAPARIAFITTGASASASELVINAMLPYVGNNVALIGSNTFGKPVGQIALDQAACDDRIRVVAFKTDNANNQGDYFTGLAANVPNTCEAEDDITRPLGDPQEASLRAALDFIGGQSCSTQPISGNIAAQNQPMRLPSDILLTPENPTPAQREVPGLY